MENSNNKLENFKKLNFDDFFCETNMSLVDDLLEKYDSVLKENLDFKDICHRLSCDIEEAEKFPKVKDLFSKFESDYTKVAKYEACLLYLVGFKNGMYSKNI